MTVEGINTAEMNKHFETVKRAIRMEYTDDVEKSAALGALMAIRHYLTIIEERNVSYLERLRVHETEILHMVDDGK